MGEMCNMASVLLLLLLEERKTPRTRVCVCTTVSDTEQTRHSQKEQEKNKNSRSTVSRTFSSPALWCATWRSGARTHTHTQWGSERGVLFHRTQRSDNMYTQVNTHTNAQECTGHTHTHTHWEMTIHHQCVIGWLRAPPCQRKEPGSSPDNNPPNLPTKKKQKKKHVPASLWFVTLSFPPLAPPPIARLQRQEVTRHSHAPSPHTGGQEAGPRCFTLPNLFPPPLYYYYPSKKCNNPGFWAALTVDYRKNTRWADVQTEVQEVGGLAAFTMESQFIGTLASHLFLPAASGGKRLLSSLILLLYY